MVGTRIPLKGEELDSISGLITVQRVKGAQPVTGTRAGERARVYGATEHHKEGD